MSGALGGMGGQSAFGTKAGDLFTRITVITVFVWILLCIVTIQRFREPELAQPGDGQPNATGMSGTDDSTDDGDDSGAPDES